MGTRKSAAQGHLGLGQVSGHRPVCQASVAVSLKMVSAALPLGKVVSLYGGVGGEGGGGPGGPAQLVSWFWSSFLPPSTHMCHMTFYTERQGRLQLTLPSL